MSAKAAQKVNVVNGVDVGALGEVIQAISADASKAQVGFKVRTAWDGQTRSKTSVESYRLGGETIRRPFEIAIDEPYELLGTNTAPNPQEVLMAALNACMTVGYVAGAAVRGITLEHLEIETEGELDLRGFLGLDPDIKPGYDSIRYTVHIKGNGTPAQFREIHENVIATSPNYFNVSQPIRLESELRVEK